MRRMTGHGYSLRHRHMVSTHSHVAAAIRYIQTEMELVAVFMGIERSNLRQIRRFTSVYLERLH